MSGLAAVVVGFGAIFSVFGLYALYLAARFWTQESERNRKAREQIRADGGLPSGPVEPIEPQQPQDDPLAHQEALPADPLHPPTVKTYQPRSGAPVRSCTCHNRPLRPGQQVVWWPVPDSGGKVWLFCREGIGVPE